MSGVETFTNTAALEMPAVHHAPGTVDMVKAAAIKAIEENKVPASTVGAIERSLMPNTGFNYHSDHGFLNAHDPVAISFWIISIAMVASTVFFLWESNSIHPHWKTSMNVGSLVTLIAGVHYFYMREYWITVGTSPIVYRYIDWSLTVPLQMIEFFLILSAAKPDISGGMFWRLLIGTVLMLAFGYAGEEKVVNPWLGFIVGMAGWGFILFEIFMGEAGSVAGKEVGQYVQSAFSTMRFIVTVGWSIYPLGYFFGYLCGAVNDCSLNLVYNLADFVNKIAFCLAIWHAAKKETRAKGTGLSEPLNP